MPGEKGVYKRITKHNITGMRRRRILDAASARVTGTPEGESIESQYPCVATLSRGDEYTTTCHHQIGGQQHEQV
jgi:hypothetical protein